MNASISGSTLDWRLEPTSSEASLTTVSHMEIYDSRDGRNLKLLGARAAAKSGSWNLSGLPAGKHWLFVRMAGKNSILNQISSAAGYNH